MDKKILIIGANGYIGSSVSSELSLSHEIVAVDNYLRPAPDAEGNWINQSFNGKNRNLEFVETSFQNLDLTFLDQFTDCIWLAGHSSVSQAMSDEYAALNNNLHDLIKFRQKFRGRFIYASSGSVYSRPNEEMCDENARLTSPSNIYDYTKTSFDHYIQATHTNAIGLRFGTVNGGSQRMRPELMLNAMCYSAKKKGVVKLSNGHAYRPVLYLPDLVQAICRIVNSDLNSGFFNLCSVNMKIKDYASCVADHYGVKIENTPSSPTYNFLMTAEKFEKAFDFAFEQDINEIIRGIDAWIRG